MASTAESAVAETRSLLIPDLLPLCARALTAVESYVALARSAVERLVSPGGKLDAGLLDSQQRAAHGLSWITTYATALRETLGWAQRLNSGGRLGEREAIICQAAFGEYLAQIVGGLPMSQGEILRPADFGLQAEAATLAADASVATLLRDGAGNGVLTRIAELIADGGFGDAALDDASLTMIREQFRRFADDHRDEAHEWHRQDVYIPMSIIEALAELGIFGLTVPENYGGLGLGKLAMCVVTEELSRGY